MLDIQSFIVALLLVGAFGYAGTLLWKKMRAFSAKSDCGDDCGCSAKTKISKIAH
jgi:hypothetical protein